MLTIYIKTCKKDLPWFKYAIESTKFVKEDFQLVVEADVDCKETLESWGIPANYLRPWKNGYIYQQWCKLAAYGHAKYPWILYLDSDTIFTRPCDRNDFFSDGKAILTYTPYEHAGDAMKWRGITEKYLRRRVLFEFMRQMPIIHHVSTLKGIQKSIPKLKESLRETKNNLFSEFNLMGAYAFYNKSPHYLFTTVPPKPYSKQYRSWDGLTKEKEEEIKKHLSGTPNNNDTK